MPRLHRSRAAKSIHGQLANLLLLSFPAGMAPATAMDMEVDAGAARRQVQTVQSWLLRQALAVELQPLRQNGHSHIAQIERSFVTLDTKTQRASSRVRSSDENRQ